MPVLATTIVNDGLNVAIVSGVLTLSASTQATGPFAPTSVLLDSATGTTMATIKKANTTAAAGDTALVVGLNPLSNAVSQTGTWTAVVSGTAVVTGTVTAVVSGTTVVSGTVTAVISGTSVISSGAVTATLNQAGAAISTTNGLWANVMFNNAIVSAGAGLPVNIVSGTVAVGNVTSALNQGGAALSSTNGIFGNILFNNTLVSASVGLPATLISGATTVGVKGASITAVATDPSLVVQFNPQSPGIIPTGTFGSPSTTVLSVQGNTSGSPIPVSGPLTLSTTATPTLATTNAYTATQVIGGIITFTGVLGSYTQGIVESITCKFNTGIMTTGLSIALFKASPAGGTYTDHGVAAINTADVPSLIGIYQIATAYNALGNHAIYNLDGIGKAFQSATSNVYGVVTSLGTTLALGNLTTFSIELGVLPG